VQLWSGFGWRSDAELNAFSHTNLDEILHAEVRTDLVEQGPWRKVAAFLDSLDGSWAKADCVVEIGLREACCVPQEPHDLAKVRELWRATHGAPGRPGHAVLGGAVANAATAASKDVAGDTPTVKSDCGDEKILYCGRG
jgi:hypothetical protein